MTSEEKLLGIFIVAITVAIIIGVTFGPPRRIFEEKPISAEAAPELPELPIKSLTKPYYFRDNAYEAFYFRKILIDGIAYIMISSDGYMQLIKCE
jgi:hypothetical protein